MSERVIKQNTFAYCVAKLIIWLNANEYQVALGEAYRTPEMAEIYAKKGVGIKNSVHTKRLAIDLMLFKDGIYLTKTEDYSDAGGYWALLDPDARWGGDFKKNPDGNHFSFECEGVK